MNFQVAYSVLEISFDQQGCEPTKVCYLSSTDKYLEDLFGMP